MKLGTVFCRTTLYIIAFLRFTTVFLVFKYPMLTVVAQLILDDIDSGFAYVGGLSWRQYTLYDKLMDYWWYVFIVIFCVGKDIFFVVLALFVLRTIGQLLILTTRNERPLFWFPNLLENFFILYLVVVLYFPSYTNYFEGYSVVLPILVAFILKMPQEYILHMTKSSHEIKWNEDSKGKSQNGIMRFMLNYGRK